jgi:hypothetical protein
MDNLLESLEPIKQMIISRLYGICGCGNPKCLKQPTSIESKDGCNKVDETSEGQTCDGLPNRSYEALARELSVLGDPIGILRYASSHRANTLFFTEDDIQELEQAALRDLALGRRLGRSNGAEQS